jgi:hypothetical protein
MLQNSTPYVILAFVLAGLNGSACATAQDAPSDPSPLGPCPLTTLGEVSEDCPWAAVARDLIKTAESAQEKEPAVQKRLEEDLPILMSRFQADRERSDWLKLWGQSLDFDELAHGVIVHPAIIQALAAELGSSAPNVASDPHIAPAGINHTYGYLFSVLQTSFGYKRARWTRPTLDLGFGFNEPTLVPLPTAGTLFGNATYFGGRIAFRNDGEKLAALRVHEDTIPERLRSFDYSKLQVTRLEEKVRVGSDIVLLRSDLVAFPNLVPSDSNSYLLIYSVSSAKTNGAVLISMFPVEPSFVTTVLNPKGLGKNKAITTRYNAYVAGLTGKKIKGSRKVIQ